MILPVPPLLVITDRRQARRKLVDVAAAAFAGGCRWLSLREKDMEPASRVELLADLVVLGRGYGATVIVHDDIAAAQAAGAGGVHLAAGGSPAVARTQLGPQALIGLSAHSDADIDRGAEEGADYVTLSPIFASASKPGYGPALGTEGLARAVLRARLPVLALGGIAAAQITACRSVGAAGVAVMGAVMAASDPAAAVAALISHFPAAELLRQIQRS